MFMHVSKSWKVHKGLLTAGRNNKHTRITIEKSDMVTTYDDDEYYSRIIGRKLRRVDIPDLGHKVIEANN